MSDLVFIVILILILFLKFVNSYFVHKMTDIFSKRNIYIHKLLYRHLLYLVGFFQVMLIRIHLGPWIRIQRYKMKGKAEFNQKIFFKSEQSIRIHIHAKFQIELVFLN